MGGSSGGGAQGEDRQYEALSIITVSLTRY